MKSAAKALSVGDFKSTKGVPSALQIR